MRKSKKKNTTLEHVAQFRFYEELNDFLPHVKAKKIIQYRFNGTPSIKDPIEAIGIPHTEVDLIIVNGYSVNFHYRLQNRDFVSVYPVFHTIDISPIAKLKDCTFLRNAFILDVHLGRLAKIMRMLGFDTTYRNDYDDAEIIQLSLREKRIILTRDRKLLHNKRVTAGYCVRSTNPEIQIHEVVKRFNLKISIRLFYRCMACNGLINRIDKNIILQRLEPKTKQFFDEFYQCDNCKRIYWKGSHYHELNAKFKKIQSEM